MKEGDREINVEIEQTESEFVTEFIQTRNLRPNQGLIIVEGKTDLEVYGYFFDQKSCRIISLYSKDKVIRVLEILNNESFSGVLAIVDADFYRIDDEELSVPNLFMTDGHDLEMMILKSLALEKLLDAFGSSKKRENFSTRWGKTIREALLDAGCPIGYLRWISQREELSLKFECRDRNGKDIREKVFGKFIDRKTLTIDIYQMSITIRNRSGKSGIDVEYLRKSINELIDANYDLWEICCGHDLACILHFAFRGILGSTNATEVKSEFIEKFLRGAYAPEYFCDTQLYESLRTWERDNPSFRILPDLQSNLPRTTCNPDI